MNTISKADALQKVIAKVERYCMDKGLKEVQPENIFDAKPDIKHVFSIPFNLNYERHFGPVQKVHFSPFHSRIFLSASVDGSIKMFDYSMSR